MIVNRTRSARQAVNTEYGGFAKTFSTGKGFTQVDYIIATGIFLVVFALVVQYVGFYFSDVVATTDLRIMTTEANDFLDVAANSAIPDNWPYINANGSILLYLHLDNSTTDSGVYGNNGISQGANCAAGILGKLDGACSFDGINDFINVAHSASLNSSNALTVEAWVKLNSYSSGSDRGVVVQKTDQYYVTINSTSGRLDAYLRGVTGNISSNSSIPIGNWTHVLVSYDGSSLRFYINGLLNNISSASGAITSSTGDVRIGGESGFNRFLNGSIDEVVVWNKSLTAQEVYQRYAYETTLFRVGLASDAYKMSIVVNNSRQAWINQSKSWVNITNELVAFNYSDLGIPARPSSTAIYDDLGRNVEYNMNGNVITFNTSVSVNTTKNFTVYFDNDASFPERSVSVTGANNLTEKIFPASSVDLIQYRKILFLNSSNYTLIKNSTQTPRNFKLTLIDAQTGTVVLSFGPDPPISGNIVAVRRFAYYQNSTGGVRGGSLSAQVW